MTRIIQGVLDFQKRIFGGKQGLFEELAKGQQPLALFITCSDSRVAPDLLAQTEPGELFILRNAGNIVPPFSAGHGAEAATVEYAVTQLKVRDIILCGHSRCGAMHGLLQPPGALASMPSVAAWVEHSRPVVEEVRAAGQLDDDARLQLAIERNVLLQLEHLKTHPSVKAALEARTLRLHGWVYHFEKGKVDYFDALSGAFAPVEQRVSDSWRKGLPKAPRTEWESRA
jgi:carbonic anhydrase